ncbi:diacylglycerol/lipid kinase family protein [Brevibacillus dissolubilis]|uniref:diacylglycerol/lipid kinase family protein n=1 Tax=Brevibacillus dissolubilis TaxID=1844116 RepID=UPI00111639E7|nr:diacylglycerol kinase family protein [Brevibacillus dissolubilis]
MINGEGLEAGGRQVSGGIGFVVNPVSGNGRGRRVWGKLERVLQDRKINYQVRFTGRIGEAEKLAAELARQSDLSTIVAVGGDGTVHEVVNGLYQWLQDNDSGQMNYSARKQATIRMGYIPAGSGNDFARAHQIPRYPLEALELILSNHVVGNASHAGIGDKAYEPAQPSHAIDLIKFSNNRVAVNVVGAGLDGQVAHEANHASYKPWCNRFGLGGIAYVISLVRILFSYQPCSLSINVDGQNETLTDVWLIAVANSPYYGGGMKICPQAQSDDGIAEICVVYRVSRWTLLRMFPQVFSGAHVSHPGVHFYRGRKITLRADKELFLQADGEGEKFTQLVIEMLPAYLPILNGKNTLN